MTEALFKVTQLTQIEEHLRDFKEYATRRADEAKSLLCTEESAQSVKKYRAELRREFDRLEEQRKAVQAAAMAPINQFNAVYKECVADAFKAADAALKGKIDETEGEIKKRCEDSLREYFDELCAAHGLDWLTFERAGIRVDMASAKQKTPKKLREQLVNFVTGISREVDAIADMEFADEILSEYKDRLDFVDAVGVVIERHRRIEQERATLEARTAQKAAEAEVVRKVEVVAPPVVVEGPTDADIHTAWETIKSADNDALERAMSTSSTDKQVIPQITFTVFNETRERLVALREWMKANNYQYK